MIIKGRVKINLVHQMYAIDSSSNKCKLPKKFHAIRTSTLLFNMLTNCITVLRMMTFQGGFLFY